MVLTSGKKQFGEWHLNNIHGVGKVEWANGDSYWGEWKDGKWEGYGTLEAANDSDRYFG